MRRDRMPAGRERCFHHTPGNSHNHHFQSGATPNLSGEAVAACACRFLLTWLAPAMHPFETGVRHVTGPVRPFVPPRLLIPAPGAVIVSGRAADFCSV